MSSAACFPYAHECYQWLGTGTLCSWLPTEVGRHLPTVRPPRVTTRGSGIHMPLSKRTGPLNWLPPVSVRDKDNAGPSSHTSPLFTDCTVLCPCLSPWGCPTACPQTPIIRRLNQSKRRQVGSNDNWVFDGISTPTSTDVMVLIYVHSNIKAQRALRGFVPQTPRLAHPCFSVPSGTKPKRVKGIL